MRQLERTVVANGLSHHVILWEGGGKATVVLCHGFLDVAFSFELVARRLSEAGHRVVAFDWRGHGESDWVGKGGYYHFPDYVLDLAELLPQLSDEPVHLVGHSMGGTATALYAATRPGTLRSLSLVEGLGPPAQAAQIAPDRLMAFLRSMQKVRSRASRPMANMTEALARMRAQHRDLDGDLGLFLAEKSTREVPGGRVFRFDPMHQTTSPMAFNVDAFGACLSRIDVATLVVAGQRGFRLPDEAQRIARIADHQFVELSGVGHMVHWFAPDALAGALIDFFRAR